MKEKSWYKEDITIESIVGIINFTKELEKEYSITIQFIDDDNSYSAWLPYIRKIEMTIQQTPQRILSTLFHELGHCYCHDMRLHKRYHHRKKKEDAIRYGLRAEKFTDKIGKKLMNIYFPTIPYLKGYNKKGVYFWYNMFVPMLKNKIMEEKNGRKK
jgi:antirestriction protein ArdC